MILAGMDSEDLTILGDLMQAGTVTPVIDSRFQLSDLPDAIRHSEDGHWILIPEDIVERQPDLKWVLTAEELGGLSDPQPLY